MRRLSPVVQAACYGLGIAVAKGVSLAMVPYMTHHLPPESYARLDVLASLADDGGVVLGLGLVDTLYRFAAADSAGCDPTRGAASRRAAAELAGLALMLALVSLGLAQAMAPWLAGVLPGGVEVIHLRLLLVSLCLTAAIEMPLAWLRLNDRAVAFLVLGAGKAVLQAALAAVALEAGWDVTGVVAATAMVDVALATVLCLLQARATGITLRTGRLGEIARYGGPLVIGGLAGFALRSCDRWFLAGRVGADDLAHYALAAKFAMATALALQPFALWWYPRRLGMLAGPNGARRSAEIVGLGLAVAILAGVAAALVGPIAIRLLTPEVYHGAAGYVGWLAAIAVMHAACSLVNVGCYAGRTGTVPMAITGAAAAMAIAGYVALVPGGGVMGAIHATVGAQAVRLGLFYAIGQRAAPVPYPMWRVAALAGLAVPLGCAGAGLAPDAAGMAVAAGGIAALGAAALGLGLMPGAWRLGLAVRAAVVRA